MKAIILAAGRGSRMKGSTEYVPKCMVELFGKSLIDRCIKSLLDGGFGLSDIIIVKGYKKEKINIPNTLELYNENWENTNMFCSLMKADSYLSQEPCLVIYSDIVFDPSIIKDLREIDSDFALSCYEDFLPLWQLRFADPLEDMETFKSKDGYLTEIGAKPDTIEEVEGQYMGLIRLEPSMWDKIKKAVHSPTKEKPLKKPLAKLDMTTLINHMINLGENIKVIPTKTLWLECDNEEDLRLYHQYYEEKDGKIKNK